MNSFCYYFLSGHIGSDKGFKFHCNENKGTNALRIKIQISWIIVSNNCSKKKTILLLTKGGANNEQSKDIHTFFLLLRLNKTKQKNISTHEIQMYYSKKVSCDIQSCNSHCGSPRLWERHTHKCKIVKRCVREGHWQSDLQTKRYVTHNLQQVAQIIGEKKHLI